MRFHRTELNPELVGDGGDLGDVFTRFVDDVLRLEHPRLRRYPTGGKDGGIDLSEDRGGVLTVVECAILVVLYGVGLSLQGAWLQSREQKILQLVTVKAD